MQGGRPALHCALALTRRHAAWLLPCLILHERIGMRNLALALSKFSGNRVVSPRSLKNPTPTPKPPPCDNSGPHPPSKKRLVTLKNLLVSLDRLADFDEIVDVRTPLEFAEDHIPGAINAPVLSNEERVIVGTMYKQVSPFEATRVGAAMVARNIAHASGHDLRRPAAQLAAAHLLLARRQALRLVDDVVQHDRLAGAATRRRLQDLPARHARPARHAARTFPLHRARRTYGQRQDAAVARAARAGAQTLDLEGLAAHRGSLLGALPGQPQPSQKAFDTALVGALRGFDPARPVFVEAESRRIGAITMPEALLDDVSSRRVRRGRGAPRGSRRVSAGGLLRICSTIPRSSRRSCRGWSGCIAANG